MAAQSYPYLAFNRGLISRFGTSRLDIARERVSAEVMTNWMPRVLGSMMLRPGLKYLGSPHNQNAARLIPFVFSRSDRAIIELTTGQMRVWINDSPLTNPTATTTLVNGTFNSDLSGWTDSDEVGATSSWLAGGYMMLEGDGVVSAIRDQAISVSVGNIGEEHAVHIVVTRGPVTLRVGSNSATDNYIAETQLHTGEHHLSFTPTGDFNIRLMSSLRRTILVSSVELATGGSPVTLYLPFGTDTLGKVRFDQSGDVVFLCADTATPYRIERRGQHSWSAVQYLPEDGPFRVMNTSPVTISLTGGSTVGIATLTASSSLFKSTHAPTAASSGALFKFVFPGQNYSESVSADDVFTEAIRVSGVGEARIFTVAIAKNTGSATFTLQRSFDGPDGSWIDVFSWTDSAYTAWNDSLDNVIIWYRLGVKPFAYSSGTHTIGLYYALGTRTITTRVTAYTSSTVVSAEVLSSVGIAATGTTADWFEGEWSDFRGWPSAVAFHESRLCWAGRGKIWLSATDAYDVFDDEIEGDSAPISRSIGSGAVSNINWLLSLERLAVGGDDTEWSIRSSSLDEPLTPTAFQIKMSSSQGSCHVDVARIDRRGLFVQTGGTRVYEMAMENDPNAVDFGVLDLTQLIPEIGEPSIVRSAVQRQPDTRAHFIRSDGTAAILIFDKVENTICWLHVTTGYPDSDVIEDVCVLPSTGVADEGAEDHVYYVVLRQHNGISVRTIEKWARESECQGGLINKQADCHVVYDGVATQTITGLSHLNGASVVVWADGLDVGTATSTGTSWTQTYTVSGGQIVLPVAASKVVVGLPYKAQWKSSKLALAAALGMPLTKRKRVHGLGIVLADTHSQGLFYGRDFTHLDPLPLMRDEKPVDPDAVLTDAEDGSLQFAGEWSTDSRICLEARAPRPCTACAIVADTEVHEQR